MVGGRGMNLSRRDLLRYGAVAGGLALVPGGLAACSSSAGSGAGAGAGGPVKLTYWDTNAGPDRTPLWQDILARFEKANPNIKVEYVGVPQGDAIQKIQTAIAGGQVPDVANGLVSTIAPYIAQNGLLALDKYFDAWKGAGRKSDFTKATIDSARSAAADRKLYAMPFTSNVNVIYYRKDLVKQLGLPDPGSSWDNFYAVADGLTDPGKGMYGFALRGGQGSVLAIESWLYAATGVDSYFDHSGKSTLVGPKMTAALKRWAGMFGTSASQNDLQSDYKAMTAEFDGGQAGMFFHNLGSYTDHTGTLGADKVGVAVLPPAPNGKLTIEGLAQTGNVVFKGTQHPEEAWKLAAYIARSGVQGPYNKAIGQLPTSTKALGESWIKDSAAVVAAQTAVNDPSAVIVDAPLKMPAYSTIQVEMEPELQKVLLGKLAAGDFLKTWADKLNAARAQQQG